MHNMANRNTQRSGKYYYARRQEVRMNRETGHTESFLEVPFILEDDSLVPDKAESTVFIGRQHFRCYYDWIPESYYTAHARDLEATAKQRIRSQRCLIPNGKGGRMMCPECNNCSMCERAGSLGFNNGHDISLDEILDIEHNPDVNSDLIDQVNGQAASAEDECIRASEDEETERVIAKIIERLTAIRPRYGLIFRQLVNGVMRPSDIARNTGLSASHTSEDIPRIQMIAAEFLNAIRNKQEDGEQDEIS